MLSEESKIVKGLIKASYCRWHTWGCIIHQRNGWIRDRSGLIAYLGSVILIQITQRNAFLVILDRGKLDQENLWLSARHLFQTARAFSNSSGLRSVYEKFRFLEGLVWKVGLTVENKAAISNFFGVLYMWTGHLRLWWSPFSLKLTKKAIWSIYRCQYTGAV